MSEHKHELVKVTSAIDNHSDVEEEDVPPPVVHQHKGKHGFRAYVSIDTKEDYTLILLSIATPRVRYGRGPREDPDVDIAPADIKTEGTYTYKIHYTAERLSFTCSSSDVKVSNTSTILCKMTSIESWGPVTALDTKMFNNCAKLTAIPPLAPGTTLPDDMTDMFSGCSRFDASLTSWDVSRVTHMTRMFEGCKRFNQSLWHWNVSKVTNMCGMFKDCEVFNGQVGRWLTYEVKDISSMFQGCKAFNQRVNNWNIPNVTTTAHTFEGCTKFNQRLNRWNVSLVDDMTSMFEDCINFNQPLTKWHLFSATNITRMFYNCQAYKYYLGWKLSKLTTVTDCFKNSPLESHFQLNNYNPETNLLLKNYQPQTSKRKAESALITQTGSKVQKLDHKNVTPKPDVIDFIIQNQPSISNLTNCIANMRVINAPGNVQDYMHNHARSEYCKHELKNADYMCVVNTSYIFVPEEKKDNTTRGAVYGILIVRHAKASLIDPNGEGTRDSIALYDAARRTLDAIHHLQVVSGNDNVQSRPVNLDKQGVVYLVAPAPDEPSVDKLYKSAIVAHRLLRNDVSLDGIAQSMASFRADFERWAGVDPSAEN